MVRPHDPSKPCFTVKAAPSPSTLVSVQLIINTEDTVGVVAWASCVMLFHEQCSNVSSKYQLRCKVKAGLHKGQEYCRVFLPKSSQLSCKEKGWKWVGFYTHQSYSFILQTNCTEKWFHTKHKLLTTYDRKELHLRVMYRVTQPACVLGRPWVPRLVGCCPQCLLWDTARWLIPLRKSRPSSQ